MQELPFRQIHLDFHTSPAIGNVAGDFDPETFVRTLLRASVNSVTCFARCHHGMLYYDSRKFPERVHPRLKRRNLLVEQTEACRKAGIRTPVYITVQWDAYTAEEHPEWIAVDEQGHPKGTPINEPGFYRYLCVNTPYRQFLKDQTTEVLEMVAADGIFFDIVQVADCSCRWCLRDMKAQGYDVRNRLERRRFALHMLDGFKREMAGLVRSINASCPVFFNEGHVGPLLRSSLGSYSHLEIESLPSDVWGYMHFPLAVRYARNLGLDCLSHTGKFHTGWGDFQSFKNQAALEFECFQMLAHNVKCMIGDQLDPNGTLSPAVYELIGAVYRQVERKEPWVRGARSVTEIGVFTTEEFIAGGFKGLLPEMRGAVRMLQESGHQFDVVDTSSDLTQYRVLVLPDRVPVGSELAARLAEFLEQGGSLLASYRSGLCPEGEQFADCSWGISLIGEAPYNPDFIQAAPPIGSGMPTDDHVMYEAGLHIEATGPETEVLAWSVAPYFNRTAEHYCSHKHAPSTGRRQYPAVIRSGRIIYFGHPIFELYDRLAPLWCKLMFRNALALLLPEPLIRHDGPGTLIVTVSEQAQERRRIVHLLHYIPERRSREIETIEDVIPLHNVELRIRSEVGINAVTAVPEGIPIPFIQTKSSVSFTVPRINGHQMIEIR